MHNSWCRLYKCGYTPSNRENSHLGIEIIFTEFILLQKKDKENELSYSKYSFNTKILPKKLTSVTLLLINKCLMFI